MATPNTPPATAPATAPAPATSATATPKAAVHTLHTSWTFWYCKKDSKATNFESTLSKIGDAKTVEDFWGIYSHMKLVSDLPKDCNLHLFRSNEMPLWEKYGAGGIWVLHLKRKSAALQLMWEELLLAAIGEKFNEPDVIGVALHTRPKEDTLLVWHKDRSLKGSICEKLKHILHLNNSVPMEYRTNKFNMTRRESNAAKNKNLLEKARAASAAQKAAAAKADVGKEEEKKEEQKVETTEVEKVEEKETEKKEEVAEKADADEKKE